MPTPHVNIKLAPQRDRPEKCSDVRAGRVESKWVDRLNPFLDPPPTTQHLEALVRYHGGLKRTARVLASSGNPVHLDTIRSALRGKWMAPSTLVRAVTMLRYVKSKELKRIPKGLHAYATSGVASEVRPLVVHLGSPGQAARFLGHIGINIKANTLRRWVLAGQSARYHRMQLLKVLAGLHYLCAKLPKQHSIVRTSMLSITQPSKTVSSVHDNM